MNEAPHYCELTEQHRALAHQHVGDIVRVAIGHGADEPALIIYDSECPLAPLLAQAYAAALPAAQVIEISTVDNEAVMAAFAAQPAGALIVLIQSTHFRLDAYRLRVQLFAQGLKVIEHVHLSRMIGDEAPRYIDALGYSHEDADYYRGTGAALQAKIGAAPSARLVSSSGHTLSFATPLEPAKLNVGDYRAMKNIGGQFPIGEVFTEAVDLEAVSGRADIYVFGDTTFHCNFPPQAITIVVEAGRITAVENSTPEFDAVLDKIRAVEGEIWIRELGLGLNRAFTRERTVSDIGTYERLCGIHLSLGAKHGSYNKPQFKRKDTRFHIDVFVDVAGGVWLGEENLYHDGVWLV
ncbi:hypothetical protein HQ393_13110 [Chitinibacter bivalviorum]|uniref:Aminopeptidase n=1 Tax=Chitinibacter bivalviorum TaxID=2739434 RepID=A0A7H9BP50_9NEIS|nr:hypothetical protein [Chitinibacter bivalviorum]QLG89104.1 hypothetical protein HQ393_13110 [Chitinibacter bivalviorum]